MLPRARCIYTLVSCISPLPSKDRLGWSHPLVKRPFSRRWVSTDGDPQNGWFVMENHGKSMPILKWNGWLIWQTQPYTKSSNTPLTHYAAPKLRFSGQSAAQLSLVSRARQFSSFIDPRLLGHILKASYILNANISMHSINYNLQPSELLRPSPFPTFLWRKWLSFMSCIWFISCNCHQLSCI